MRRTNDVYTRTTHEIAPRSTNAVWPLLNEPLLLYQEIPYSTVTHQGVIGNSSSSMRWWHGYFVLWTLVVALCYREFVELVRTLRFDLPRIEHVTYFLAYVFALALLSVVLPGKMQTGALLSDGHTRLRYKCNGLLVAGVTVTLFGAGVYSGRLDGAVIANHLPQLFVVANVFSLVVSVALFLHGRATRRPNWLAPRGVVEDFVLGATLNPTMLGVDLKFFSYRPAMVGWLLINLSYACAQHAAMGTVTARMALYQILTAWYIWDYFVHEPKMVYTWDIIAEHFGLMLVWADYVFIPFMFSVQNSYLLHDTSRLSAVQATLTLSCFAVGFAIFRGANSQKHQFKTNPTAHIWGKPPVVVGGRLLASGFWGVARHLNYTGDLLLAFSYCAPCGVRKPLAYFYFFYLLLLCVHREKRDDERCAAKYKTDWDEYCLRVPYRMVPLVY